jgi:hypothetical protein
MRVFHGITGSAGQPGALARALREHGIEARSAILGSNKMNYPADDIVLCSPFDFRTIGRYLSENLDRFDIFHLHMRPMFYQNIKHYIFPTFHDMILMKAAGKKVCFHFRGSEARLASVFREKNPFHYVDDDPDRIFRKFHEDSQKRYISFISGIADRVFVTDPELQTYVPGSHIVPRIFEPLPSVRAGPLRTERPVIVHAPSRRGVKGTNAVLAAVETLKSEGLSFEFRLVEGLANDEALRVYADSDIIVDQLRIGWYGVLAVEAMAMGRTVVSYVRDDLVKGLGPALPIANANPLTIADVLRRCVTDYGYRASVAASGHEWFAKTHSSSSVVPLLINHYEEVMAMPPAIDAKKIQELIEYQFLLPTAAGRKSHHYSLLPVASMSIFQKFMYVQRNDGTIAALDVAKKYIYRSMRSWR